MTDAKTIELETALAHHERQIQDLSAMIGAQWQEIDRLRSRLDAVLMKIGDDATDAANVKPPHF